MIVRGQCAYSYTYTYTWIEKGVVAVPAQDPAHPQQLQDWPDNLQHASLHSQMLPLPR